MDKTLQEIKETEQEAMKIIENSKKNAEKILNDVFIRKDAMEKELIRKIEEKRREEQKRRMKAIEQEKSESMKKAKEEIIKIENKAKKNNQKAISFIVNECKTIMMN